MSPDPPYRLPFASYPAIRLCLLLMGGIVADYQLNPPIACWAGLFTGIIVLYLLMEFRQSKSSGSIAYPYVVICYLLTIFTFGGTWHALMDPRDPPPEAKILESYQWEELTFTGRIYEHRTTSRGSSQLNVAVDTTFFSDSLSWARSYNLQALLKPEVLHSSPLLRPGDRVTFSAMLYPLEGPRNPHEFNYRRYLATQNIYLRGGITNIHQISSSGFSLDWIMLRETVLQAIDRNFSPSASPLAKALLVGYKNDLDPEEKREFSRAGLSHIMAVSGLHVGFLLVPFWLLIPWFWTLRYGKLSALVLLILLLIFYAGLTGFSASVTRAALAGGFLVYARLYHQVRDSKNLMAVAALLILIYNPADLFTVSFQLSFSAVYIILLLMPVVNHWMSGRIQNRWHRKLIDLVIISLIVQAGLFPFLTYYFGEYSFISPLTNLMVLPMLGIILPFALLLLPMGLWLPELTRWLNSPADWFLQYIGWMAEWASRQNGSWLSLQTDDLLIFAIWGIGLFFLAALPHPKRRWKLLVLLLALLCLHQGKLFLQNLQPARLRVTVMDVGQGDATLMSTPGGSHYLVDTGRWEPGYNSGRHILLPHLKAEGIDKLDGIFLSHPHADHIGGILDIMNAMPVDTIYYPGGAYNSDLYRQFLRQAERHQIPLRVLSAGDQVRADPALRLFVYGPAGQPAITSNTNNRSLVLEIIYGSTQFLFPGDAEAVQEEELIFHFGPFLETDVLKAAHHGSNTSSTPSFLSQSTPEIVVVSVGQRNRFQHPHRSTLERIRASGGSVYTTSLQGAVIFESDGNTITSIPWR